MRLIALTLLIACAGTSPSPSNAGEGEAPAATPRPEAPMFKDLELTRLDGAPIEAGELDGKPVLFVNVASRCGFTPQYDGLQKLHDAYAEKGLRVVGVPCNQFGGQEPGSPEQIATFCQENYGVSFTMLEKQDVNGNDRSPLYAFLIDSEAGGGKRVQWNFEKFLVGRDGKVIGRWGSRTKPDDLELKRAIEAAL